MDIAHPTYEPRRLIPVARSRSARFRADSIQRATVWRSLILLLDLAAWALSFCTVLLLRMGTVGLELNWTTRLVVLGLCPAVVIVLTLYIVGGYDRRTDMLSLTYVSEHLIGMGAALVGASVLVYCFAGYELPVKPGRATLLLAFIAFTPLSLLYRRAIGVRLLADMARKHFIVLGNEATTSAFFEAYRRSPSQQGLRYIDLGAVKDGGEASLLTELSELDDVEGVVVTAPLTDFSESLRDHLVRLHFQRTPVFTLDTFYETYWRRIPVYALNPAWPLQLGFQLARSSPYQHLKRLLDVVGATVGLVLLAPVFFLIALLTWWDSGSPVIFRQERVGRGNEPFTIFKFRTMRTRQESEPDDLYTRTNDSRVTRIGKVLRKCRLDELPQLWNVLRGDMSLIGPRAEWVRCAEIYERNIPSYHFRHLVKPGITGWAQVNYAYGENEEDAVQKLKYDLYYIRRYSLRLDAMIVLKTLHIMFWGKGQ